MTDSDLIIAILPQLTAHRCDDYESWLKIGMACKTAGVPIDVWDSWSRRSNNWKAGACADKWRSFRGSGTTVATLVRWCKEDGGAIPKEHRHVRQEEDRSLDWDSPIGGRGAREDGPTMTAAGDTVEPLPAPSGNPSEDLARYLEALYKPDEFVSYVVQAFADDDGNYKPSGHGVYHRTAGQLAADARKYKDDLGFAVGDWTPAAGAWIRLNPVDGKLRDGARGITDDNVTEYRHCLVECDSLPVEQQLALIRELQLPCAAIVNSGGKSVHAVVKIDAGQDRKLYRDRVEYLFKLLADNGFEVDRQCKNPSRLSRMPGIKRGDKMQYLIGTNEGCKDWNEWEAYSKEDTFEYESMTPSDLWAVDLDAETDGLILPRFLTPEAAWIIVAQSGVGKSTFCIQCAMHWAIGRAFMSLKVPYPMKQIIIQSENNKLDLTEPFQKITAHMNLTPEERALLNKNLVFVNDSSNCGDKFAPFLAQLCQRHAPKIVWIDPILAYIGGNIGEQEVCSKFFRNQLNPVLKTYKVGAILMHHPTKPPKEKADVGSLNNHDLAYMGGGSYDMTNWARAISVIQASIVSDVYTLTHCKRDSRLDAPRVTPMRRAAKPDIWWSLADAIPPAPINSAGGYGGRQVKGEKRAGFWALGLDNLAPVKHDPDPEKSALLAVIIKLSEAQGEFCDLKKAESLRKCAAKAKDAPLVYDAETGLWRGRNWF